MLPTSDADKWAAIAQKAAADQTQTTARNELAKFTAETFTQVGEELHAVGHIFGSDRISGASPFGHGNDEIVAVSLLFRIGGQLTSASVDLFADGRHYAAAALLRQIRSKLSISRGPLKAVIRTPSVGSAADERRNFFTPAKLRKAANGKFRGKDYGYHCELGGHPVPNSFILLRRDEVTCQLLLSDLLGHTGRIWDHMLDWSAGNEWAIPIHRRREEMYKKYAAWKRADELTLLPPP